MRVREIMTRNPECCTPDTAVEDIARAFVTHDCGALPVVENQSTLRPIGIVTDRDIVCRTIAEGRNPFEMTAKDVMTGSLVTVDEDATVEVCVDLMRANKVRRLPVVDPSGRCTGMVAQADVAANADEAETAEVVKEISEAAPSTR